MQRAMTTRAAGAGGCSRKSGRLVGLLGAALLLASGCSYERAVQDVARDWCLTIRASQVVPVYPLTEDLQPGDVFLVTLPSNEQQKIYDKQGFLPLDVQAARLEIPTEAFDGFYAKHFFTADYASGGVGKERLRRFTNEDGSADSFAQAFNVPRASFPTYTVDIKRSGGFKAAIPIQSIPVGVSLLGADSAVASVNIADAYTYAADPTDIDAALQEWVDAPSNRKRLLDYNVGRPSDEPLFLRVIQRVYLTGGVTASVARTSQSAAGADVGMAQEVGSLRPGSAASIERFAAAQEALSDAINSGLLAKNAMPGASIRLASATSRSVTLNERFDRPVAIGYIGVDYEIREDGSLGAALSTRDVLNGRALVSTIRSSGDDALTDLDIAIASMEREIATLAGGSEDDQATTLRMVRRALSQLPADEAYAELRSALEGEISARSAARRLGQANRTYRAGEAGRGPHTTMVFTALAEALRDPSTPE